MVSGSDTFFTIDFINSHSAVVQVVLTPSGDGFLVLKLEFLLSM